MTTEQEVSATATDVKKAAENEGHSLLTRLLLWVRNEANEIGVDIMSEMDLILEKLHLKSAPVAEPAPAPEAAPQTAPEPTPTPEPAPELSPDPAPESAPEAA